MSISQIYLFLVMLALCGCTQVCLVEKMSRGYSPAEVRYLLQRLLLLWSMGSRVGELQYLPNTGLVAPWHMVSSPARIEPAVVVWFCVPCFGSLILNHQITREVLYVTFESIKYLMKIDVCHAQSYPDSAIFAVLHMYSSLHRGFKSFDSTTYWRFLSLMILFLS